MVIFQKKIFWIIAAIGLITCFFSQGFHHPDEHFSIIEIMSWLKTGVPHPDFGWDVQLLIRPTIQPAFYLIFEKIFDLLNIFSPFTRSFIFRLLSFSLSSLAIILFLKSFNKFEKDNFTDTRMNLILAFFLIWFIPYFFARTSSENMSLAFFFLGASLIFDQKLKFLAGLLFAFSFAARFQMAIPVGMTTIWLLFFRRDYKIKQHFVLISGLLAGILIMFLMDSWLYHQWVFTPWNYFRENILYSRVNEFGIHPWHFYLTSGMTKGGFILPLALLIGSIYYISKKPKSYLVWIGLPFLLIHNLIGHKELRFLLFFYVVMIIMTFESVRMAKLKQKLVSLILILMLPLTLKVMLTPAYSPMKIYEYIYDNKIDRIDTPQHMGQGPLKLMMSYYVSKNLKFNSKNFEEIKNQIRPFHVLTSTFSEYEIFSDLNCHKLTSVYPEWLVQLNPFNFRSRSSLWTLWKCD